MLNRFRTYRTTAACVASLLLLSTVLPAVAHACTMAMNEQHGMMSMRCCCNDDTTHTDHHDAACPTQHSSHSGSLEQAPCCLTIVQDSDLEDGIVITERSLRLPVTLFAVHLPADIVYRVRFGTHDPLPPIPFQAHAPPSHILYNTFLI